MPPVSIVKATLSVRSDFSPAEAPDDYPADYYPPGGINAQSWGYITLWDVRPWLPWTSRGYIGILGWQGYLLRGGVMDSTQSPLYTDHAHQISKRWPTLTATKDIIYTDRFAVQQYDNCALYGSPPYSYHNAPPGSSGAHDLAFDPTTVASFLSTLVIAVYAMNSYPPLWGGPDDNDSLNVYFAVLDVHTSDGVTTHYIPSSVIPIDGGVLGPDVDTAGNYLPGTYNAANALDEDPVTCATVFELNSDVGLRVAPFASMWHPAVMLITGWIPETGGGGIRNHSFLGVMAMGTGPDASFVG